jgi:hypothetical protein
MKSPNKTNARESLLTRRTFGLLLSAATATVCGRLSAAENAQEEMTFPRLTRGINLHHLLNWPDTTPGKGRIEYVWPPFETVNYKISDDELSRLKAMRFDFLRVTADPSIFLASGNGKREHLIRLVRQTVNRFIGAGFNVIFDLHPVAVNPDYAPLKIIENIDSPVFRAYADLVEQMARSLNDLPRERFAFELMNEPWLDSRAEVARWQPMLELLHAHARHGSATLPLILGGAQWSSARALVQLDLRPFKGSNVLYTFHYYDPHTFTHQGVGGDEGAFLGGLQWPPAHDNIVRVRDAAFVRIETTNNSPAVVRRNKDITRKLLTDYELAAHDRQCLHDDFAAVAKWAAQRGIPPQRIFLGEFGCVNAANNIPLGEDRARWLRAVRDAAEEFGFAWALWAYKGYGGMALLDNKDQIDIAIVKALDLQR